MNPASERRLEAKFDYQLKSNYQLIKIVSEASVFACCALL